MSKMLSFNKYIYIHIYIFFCFINLTNQETEILSITIKDKTWKFTVNNSKNAATLYHKLKSKEKMNLQFSVVKVNNEKSLYWEGTSLSFEPSGDSEVSYEKYHIYAGQSKDGKDVLYIILDPQSSAVGCYDIGEITDGIDNPFELDDLFDKKETSDDLKVTLKLEIEGKKKSLGISHIILALMISLIGMVIFTIFIIFSLAG